MATFTIFGTSAPSDFTTSSDPSEISVSTSFYVLGVSGWRVQGVRIYIPADATVSSTGHIAYLWTGVARAPDSQLASANFIDFTAGEWNTAYFSSPISLIAGKYYWAQVYCPASGHGIDVGFFASGSATPSVDTSALYAAGNEETSTGQGSYVLGDAGQAPAISYNSAFYGVDVLVDDGSGAVGPNADNDVGISDAVVYVRSGLPEFAHASGSATDSLGTLTAASAASFPVGGATAFHTVRRRLFETRIQWGAVTNTSVKGPIYNTDTGPLTLGVTFYVLWPCRFVGGNIYKPPNAFGSIPVRLWDTGGAGGAVREMGNATLTWVVDAGGWRSVEFSPAIDLVPDMEYTMSWYSPSTDYVASTYVFHWWSDVVPPFRVAAYQELPSGVRVHGSAFRQGTAQLIPNQHVPTNYYIEPMVEWDSREPVFVPDPEMSYFDQWVNYNPDFKFMWGVYQADPPYLQEYVDMGIKLVFSGMGTPDYEAATVASGMYHMPNVGRDQDPNRVALRAVAENPAYAAQVIGYLINDEPDQYFPYTPPEAMRGWCRDIRLLDSTRPLNIGMGRVVGINGTFTHQPQGSNMDVANELWRGWAQLADILDGDFYSLSDDQDPENIWGVWIYPPFVRRLRQLNEGRAPIWISIETTSGTPNQPLPGDVVKACWASIIEGAVGVDFFDHRFRNNYVSQDFAHMLHNPPMKAAVSALIVRVNAIADAILSPNTNIVTAVTSSNTTAGPLGGTYGVPMHWCTKADTTHEYLFAMGIRPGSTVATFTIPSWAGETVTVIDESRTVVVSGAGVLTDSFPADYTVHIYQRAL